MGMISACRISGNIVIAAIRVFIVSCDLELDVKIPVDGGGYLECGLAELENAFLPTVGAEDARGRGGGLCWSEGLKEGSLFQCVVSH